MQLDVLSKKRKELLLGNEAIVRGALESGIDVATTYPGTPSSEIADTFSEIAIHLKNKGEEPSFYFQYSTNEKVALEFAAAASVAGLRSLTCMKHVGLNVASDAFITYMYVGCKGGHLIVTADDPSCHSSQNEQDNRYYAILANSPMLEPSSPQEAKDMTISGFKISEELRLPVLLRTTTRLSHSRGPVSFGKINWEKKKKKGEFEKNPLMVTVPAVARKCHPILLKKMERAEKISEESRFNKIIEMDGNRGIVTSGVSYNYVMEAVEDLGIKCRILKLGMTNPLPKKMCEEFIHSCREIIVVEELEPFLEDRFKAMAQEIGEKVKIYGKGYGKFTHLYEYDLDIVEETLGKMFGKKVKKGRGAKIKVKIPSRPPTLCPGCPHRAAFYAVKKVAPKNAIFPTDIGCYTLGKDPPLEIGDFLLCMGSNAGTACGFSHSTDQKVVSFMGDSTFFHAGMPAIINAVHHDHDCVITILDNRTTAMTGHQPHPGIEEDGMGGKAVPIKVEEVVKGLGVKHVQIVNPNNLEETKKAFKNALEYEGTSVVVAKAPCILLELRKKRREGKEIIPYVIDREKCVGCDECMKFGCPAFYIDDGEPSIDEEQCTSCGVCAQICRFDAIRRKDEL